MDYCYRVYKRFRYCGTSACYLCGKVYKYRVDTYYGAAKLEVLYEYERVDVGFACLRVDYDGI